METPENTLHTAFRTEILRRIKSKDKKDKPLGYVQDFYDMKDNQAVHVLQGFGTVLLPGDPTKVWVYVRKGTGFGIGARLSAPNKFTFPRDDSPYTPDGPFFMERSIPSLFWSLDADTFLEIKAEYSVAIKG